MNPADHQRARSGPLVVDIIGLPGSGKSTLADALASILLGQGASVCLARKNSRPKLAGWFLAVADGWFAYKLFRSCGASVRLALKRSLHGLPAAAAAKSAGLGKTPDVIIREPGWAMQLVGIALAEELGIPVRLADKTLALGGRAHTVVILPTDVQAAYGQACARQRGLPAVLQGLSQDEVMRRFAFAQSACTVIQEAASAAGTVVVANGSQEELIAQVLMQV